MKLTAVPTIAIQLKIELTENEARALDALAGYGADAFLKVFYEKLGEHYMRPHEAGLRSLFEGIRETLPKHLSKAEEARACFIKSEMGVSDSQVNTFKDGFLTK